MNFAPLIPALIDVSKAAGAKIMEVHARGVQAEFKGDGSPVTEADQAAEDLILPILKNLTPDIRGRRRPSRA